jgi:hypothetical protein
MEHTKRSWEKVAAFVLLGATMGTALLPSKAEAAPQQARKADDFVDSIGICTKVGYFDNDSAGWDNVRSKLSELGVRFYREGLEHVDNPTRKSRLQGLYDSYGMKMLALCGPYGNDNLQPQNGNLNHIPPKVAGIKPFLYAVEGPNEPDLFWHDPWNYGGYTNRVDQVVWYQNTLYNAIKNYSATSDVPVTSFATAYGEYSSNFVGKPFSHDMVAWHHYNNPWKPNPWQLSYERGNYNSNKPGILTEHGYNVNKVSQKAQGKYNARSAAYFFDWNNNVKTFFYVLGPDGEDYGLLNSNWTPRPAFNALKSVISYVKEGTWNTSTKTWNKPNFTPGSLDFNITGDTADVWWRLLQKSNDEFYLLIWNNSDSYTTTGSDIDSSRNITISFPQSRKVVQYRGNDSGVYSETTLTNGATSLGVNVPDSLMILKITNGGAVSGAPIGQRIGFKSTANNRFVSANLNDSSFLVAQWATSPGSWEKFDVVDAGSGQIALRSAQTGRYVSCDMNTAERRLRADWATGIGSWERFTWEDRGNSNFALKSVASGRYVSADLNTTQKYLKAQWATSVGSWENFQWTPSP